MEDKCCVVSSHAHDCDELERERVKVSLANSFGGAGMSLPAYDASLRVE